MHYIKAISMIYVMSVFACFVDLGCGITPLSESL